MCARRNQPPAVDNTRSSRGAAQHVADTPLRAVAIKGAQSTRRTPLAPPRTSLGLLAGYRHSVAASVAQRAENSHLKRGAPERAFLNPPYTLTLIRSILRYILRVLKE